MTNAILRMLTGGFTVAALVYLVASIIERQLDKIFGAGFAFVTAAAIFIFLWVFEIRQQNKTRYDSVRQQRLVAPASVESVRYKREDDDDNSVDEITAVVYPPDMPPYLAKFERRITLLRESGEWRRGRVFKALLANPENGEVDFAGWLDTEFPHLNAPTATWENLVADYIQGGAPAYRGPAVPGVEPTAWRSLQIPQKARLHPMNRPLGVAGVVAGLVIGVLLCQTSFATLVQRLQHGETSPLVYESSVLASAGAQNILERSGADTFYIIALGDSEIGAGVPTDGDFAYEYWPMSLDAAFLPGHFALKADVIRLEEALPDYQETFGFDDVNWEMLPKIVADANEACVREYDSGMDSESVQILVQDGELQFAYSGLTKSVDKCDRSYSMDGQLLGG